MCASLSRWRGKTKLGLSGFSYTLSKDQKQNAVINMYILTGQAFVTNINIDMPSQRACSSKIRAVLKSARFLMTLDI